MTDTPNDDEGPSERRRPGPRNKVVRVIEAYGLGDTGARLEAEWTAPEDGRSLRELADWFNRRVLETALADAGVPPSERDVAETYRLLSDDDVTGGERRQVEARLERTGVDVESLRRDFVTHQAIHSYLTKVRGASAPTTSDEGQLRKDRDRLERLRNRTFAVTEETVGRLSRTDRLALDSFSVFVNVQVVCEDCGTRYEASELLRAGGCDCRSERSDE
ncbi:rod-determining factor RdfA [Halomarina halobia]|uniref:Rod-determining factor RdfA n=1 Tax=Halomarina halobia TaxID=3033386 RepID=A0ABD6ADB7_9EURY|nr:rod-determining factor RdfA [Halomarina sp. PSR21]